MQESTTVVYYKDVQYPTQNVNLASEEQDYSLRKNVVNEIVSEDNHPAKDGEYLKMMKKSLANDISENKDLNKNESNYVIVSGDPVEVRFGSNDSHIRDLCETNSNENITSEFAEVLPSEELEKCSHPLIEMKEARSVTDASCTLTINSEIEKSDDRSSVSIKNESHKKLCDSDTGIDNYELKFDSLSAKFSSTVEVNNSETFSSASNKLRSIRFSAPLPINSSLSHDSNIVSHLAVPICENVAALFLASSALSASEKTLVIDNSCESSINATLKIDTLSSLNCNNSLPLTVETDVKTATMVPESSVSDADCVMDLRCEPINAQSAGLLSSADSNEITQRSSKTNNSILSIGCTGTPASPEFVSANKTSRNNRSYAAGKIKDPKTRSRRLDSVVKDLSMRADDRNNVSGLSIMAIDTGCHLTCSDTSLSRHQDSKHKSGPQFINESAEERKYSSLSCDEIRSTVMLSESETINIDQRQSIHVYDATNDEAHLNKAAFACPASPNLQLRSLSQQCDKFTDDFSQIKCHLKWGDASSSSDVTSKITFDDGHALNLSMTAVSTDSEASATALNLTSNRSRTINSNGGNDQGITFSGAFHPNSPNSQSIDISSIKMPFVKANKVSAVYLDEGTLSRRSNLMSFNDVFLNHLKKADDNTVCMNNVVSNVSIFPVSTVPSPVSSAAFFFNSGGVECENLESLCTSSTDLNYSQNATSEVPKMKDVTKRRRNKPVCSEIAVEFTMCASRSDRDRIIYNSGVPDTTYPMPLDVPVIIPDQIARLNSVDLNFVRPVEAPIQTSEIEQTVAATIPVKGITHKKKKGSKKTKEVAINLCSENQFVAEDLPVNSILSLSTDLPINNEILMDDSCRVISGVNANSIKPKKSAARNSKGKLKITGVQADTDCNIVSDKIITPEGNQPFLGNSLKLLELVTSKIDIDILDNANRKILDNVSCKNLEVDAIAMNIEQLVLGSKKSTASRNKKSKVKQNTVLLENLALNVEQQTQASDDNCSTKSKLPRKRKYSSTKATTIIEGTNTQQSSSVLDFHNTSAVISTEQCIAKAKDISEIPVKLVKQNKKRNSKKSTTPNIVNDPMVVIPEPLISISNVFQSSVNIPQHISMKKPTTKRKKKVTDFGICDVPIVEVSKLSETLIAEPKIKKTKVSRSKANKKNDMHELPSEVVSTTVENVSKEFEFINPLQQESNETITNKHDGISNEQAVGTSVTELVPVSSARLTKRKQKEKSKNAACSVDEAGLHVVQGGNLPADQSTLINLKPILDIKQTESKATSKRKTKKQLALEKQLATASLLANENVIISTELAEHCEQSSCNVECEKLTRVNSAELVGCTDLDMHQPILNTLGINEQLASGREEGYVLVDQSVSLNPQSSVDAVERNKSKTKPKRKSKKQLALEKEIAAVQLLTNENVMVGYELITQSSDNIECSTSTRVNEADLHVGQHILSGSNPIKDTQLVKSNEQLTSDHQTSSLLEDSAVSVNLQPSISVIEQNKSKAKPKRKLKKQLALEKEMTVVQLLAGEKVVVNSELVVQSSNIDGEKLKAGKKSKKGQSNSSAIVSKHPFVEDNANVSTDSRYLEEEGSQNKANSDSQIKPVKTPKLTKKRKYKNDVDHTASSVDVKSDLELLKDDEESTRRIMETLAKVASGENFREGILPNESLNISSMCNTAEGETEDRHVATHDGLIASYNDSIITMSNNESVEASILSKAAPRTTAEMEGSYMSVINDVAKCPEEIDSSDLLKSKHEEGERPFVCPRCRYTARKKGQLRKHLGVHGIYACAHCAYTSDGHSGLDEHMTDNHPSRCGRRLCKRCHVLFRLDLIDAHEAECTGVKLGWDCSVCGKRFKFVSAMHTHLRRWHGSSTPTVGGNDGNPECRENSTPAPSSVVQNENPGCNEMLSTSSGQNDTVTDNKSKNDLEALKSSSDESVKKKHKKKKRKSEAVEGGCVEEKDAVKLSVNVSSDQIMKCGFCSKSFKLQQSLDKHVALKHVNPVETTSDNLNQTQYQLEVEAGLQSSAVISSSINSFACDVPHASSVQESSTENAGAMNATASSVHKVDTSDIKKVDFEMSSADDKSESNNKLPALTVTAERFFCTAMACGKEFRKIAQLHRHAEKHIGEDKPHRCDWSGCRKAFIFAENLASHKLQHTDPKPFPCSQCSAGYWQKCSLRVHQRRMHRVTASDKKNSATTTTTTNQNEIVIKSGIDDDSTDIDDPCIEQKETTSAVKDAHKQLQQLQQLHNVVKDSHVGDMSFKDDKDTHKQLHNDAKVTHVNDMSCKDESNVNVTASVDSIEYVVCEDTKLEPKRKNRLKRQKVKRGKAKLRKASVQKHRSLETNLESLPISIIPSEVQSVTTEVEPIPTKSEVEPSLTKTEIVLIENSKPTKIKKVNVKKERLNIRGRKAKHLSDVKLSSASSIHDISVNIDKMIDRNKEILESCVVNTKKRTKSKLSKSNRTRLNEKQNISSKGSVKVKTSLLCPAVSSDVDLEPKPKIESKEISVYEFCEEEDHKVELIKSIRRLTTTSVKDVALKPMSSNKQDTNDVMKKPPVSVKPRNLNRDIVEEIKKPPPLPHEQDTFEVIKKAPVSLKTYMKPRNKNSNLEIKMDAGSDVKPIASNLSDIISPNIIPVQKTARTTMKRKLDVVDSGHVGNSQVKNKQRSPKKFSGSSASNSTENRKSNAANSGTDDECVKEESSVPTKKKQSKKVEIDAVTDSATKTVRKRRKLEIENVNIICEGTVRMTMIEAQIRITEMSRDGSRKNTRKNSKKSDVVATFPQIEFTAKTDKYKRGKISKIEIKDCRHKRRRSLKSKRKPLRKQASSFEVIDVSCKKAQNKSQKKSKSKPCQGLSKSCKMETNAEKENAKIDLGEEPCVELSIVEAVSRIAKKRSEQLLKPVVFDESSNQSSIAEERVEYNTYEQRDETSINDISARSMAVNTAHNVGNTVNPLDTEKIKIDSAILNRDRSMISAVGVVSSRDVSNNTHLNDMNLIQLEKRRAESDGRNSEGSNDYERQLKDTRPLPSIDIMPMEDISPRNLENLSVPSTGSPYSSERDDDEIPTTPTLLRQHQASNSSKDSLDSKEQLPTPRESQFDYVTREDQEENIYGTNSSNQAETGGATNTPPQSHQLDERNERQRETSVTQNQSRNYGDDNQRIESVREYMDNNAGRYESSMDNYADNQEIYRERSLSPRSSHHLDRPQNNASRNAYVYDASAYPERQYTHHRVERNPLESLEGLAAGTVTGSPGRPSGGYFDQSQEEVGGKQAMYIQPHHRSTYGMISPHEGYLTDLVPPPSVGRQRRQEGYLTDLVPPPSVGRDRRQEGFLADLIPPPSVGRERRQEGYLTDLVPPPSVGRERRQEGYLTDLVLPPSVGRERRQEEYLTDLVPPPSVGRERRQEGFLADLIPPPSVGREQRQEGYLADLLSPPSVGRPVPASITHSTSAIDPTIAHGQQDSLPSTSHTTTPTGHEIQSTHVAPPPNHGAPTPGHSTVPPPGHSAEYGRVSDPRFMNQRSPDNSALSRTVPHSAVPGFPSDSFAKDFFGQYFQDPASHHLSALSGPGMVGGQDQRSLGGYMGQQLPGGFSRTQTDFFRCTPSALISNSPYPSIPESFLGMKPPPAPGGIMSQSPQSQHWSSSGGEDRSRPWSNQTPSMLDMESSGSRNNTFSKQEYGSSETMSSHSSKRGSAPGGANTPSDLIMFPGGTSSSSLPPPPVAQSADKYGMPSAYSSLAHAYSPTGSAAPGVAAATSGGYSSRGGLAGASSSSQKQLEDAYRHAAAAAQLNDYRTLAAAQAQHAQMPPDVYMAGFDRYYYASARDAMYRSHHLAAASAMPHHFMQQGGASSQQVYGDRGGAGSVGYGREGMYAQPSPYSFIGRGGGSGSSGGEKQYTLGSSSGSGGKGSSSHGGPSVAHSEYLPPPNSAVDVQDPYRRSVIYNMMTPRYF